MRTLDISHAFIAGSPREVIAEGVLDLLFRFRRSVDLPASCGPRCESCRAPHLAKISQAIARAEPIGLVLPAFPGKSPNLAKVLGTLPDLAEELALVFLQELCDAIGNIYAPGAKILLCSDGRVFSDVVGMREEDVSAYQQEIERMIRDLKLDHLSCFHLDQLSSSKSAAALRAELLADFGVPVEVLQAKVRGGAAAEALLEEREANRMFRGITRFLVEDASFPGQTKSRTQIQKESKANAYEVIRRSNAWSGLIAMRFPQAVRLSIHPQGCGASKLGLRLLAGDSWITPWHGVALKTASGFTLVKRQEAEGLGAELKLAGGKPSHFEMKESQ